MTMLDLYIKTTDRIRKNQTKILPLCIQNFIESQKAT